MYCKLIPLVVKNTWWGSQWSKFSWNPTEVTWLLNHKVKSQISRSIFIFAFGKNENARATFCAPNGICRQITTFKNLTPVLIYVEFVAYQACLLDRWNIKTWKLAIEEKNHNISVTTIARWPKAWRVDQPVDEWVYVREGRPRDPLNHNIAIGRQGG